MTARLQRSAEGVLVRCPCRVGQTTCFEGGLGIAFNSGLEGDRVTDLRGNARLGGQMCPL